MQNNTVPSSENTEMHKYSKLPPISKLSNEVIQCDSSSKADDGFFEQSHFTTSEYPSLPTDDQNTSFSCNSLEIKPVNVKESRYATKHELHRRRVRERAEKRRKEFIKKHHRTPIVMFRVIVKQVMREVLPLLEQRRQVKRISIYNDPLFFNKGLFKNDTKTRKLELTNSQKKFLQYEPNERSDFHLDVCKDVIGCIKQFHQYSPKIQFQLTRSVFYATYNAGQVMIKKGHVGKSCYYILKGQVKVIDETFDEDTGTTTKTTMEVLTEGASFGDSAMLQEDSVREFTVKCSENYSEFLCIDGEVFRRVLNEVMGQEMSERMTVLKSIPEFHELSDYALSELRDNSVIQEYHPKSLIRGNTNSVDDTMQYIFSGVCEISRDVKVVRELLPFGKEKLHLLEDVSFLDCYTERPIISDHKQSNKGKRIFLPPQHLLLSVGLMSSGLWFGLGENLLHTYILAKTKVEVLRIKRIHFIKHVGLSLLDSWKEDVHKCMPTNHMLLKKYREDSKWDHYKQNTVKDIVSKNKKTRHNANWEDVPLCLLQNSLRAGSLQDIICSFTSFSKNYNALDR